MMEEYAQSDAYVWEQCRLTDNPVLKWDNIIQIIIPIREFI